MQTVQKQGTCENYAYTMNLNTAPFCKRRHLSYFSTCAFLLKLSWWFHNLGIGNFKFPGIMGLADDFN
jgi:hypothetical protein